MHSTKHKVSHALIALAVLLSAHTIAFAQLRSMQGWVWQNPQPQGNTLFSIHFAKDKELGYAVGADMTVLRTDDGGFSWRREFVPVDTNLSGVFVRDRKNAVAVGSRGTILITNNAKDWKRLQIDARDQFYGVAFAGEDLLTGWVVGTYGRILRSDDGGWNWQPQSSGTTEHLLKVSAFDEQHASVVGASGTVLATSDGGKTWVAGKPCGASTVSASAYISRRKSRASAATSSRTVIAIALVWRLTRLLVASGFRKTATTVSAN